MSANRTAARLSSLLESRFPLASFLTCVLALGVWAAPRADRSPDSTQALQQALRAHAGKVLVTPPGTYVVSDTLEICSHTTWMISPEARFILAPNSNKPILKNCHAGVPVDRTGAQRRAGFVTLTTAVDHGLQPGGTIQVAGVWARGKSAFDGVFKILGVPDGRTLTYRDPRPDEDGGRGWVNSGASDTNITIKGGVFDGNKDEQTADYATLEFINLSDSRFEGVQVIGNRQAVYLEGAFDCLQCTKTVFQDCNVSQAGQEGLFLRFGSNNQVIGGDYSNNGSSGVSMAGEARDLFQRIRATDNFGSNLSINGPYARVLDNYLAHSLVQSGVAIGHPGTLLERPLSAANSVVTGNTVKDNVNAGIVVQGEETTDVLVSNNIVEGNSRRVTVAIAAAPNGLIRRNGQVTVHTESAHNLRPVQMVSIKDAADPSFNGTVRVALTPAPDEFVYNQPGSDGRSGGGTVQLGGTNAGIQNSSGASGLRIVGNQLRGNFVGIKLYNGSHSRVERNTVAESENAGIALQLTDDTDVVDNTSENNGAAAGAQYDIWIDKGGNNRIDGNQCSAAPKAARSLVIDSKRNSIGRNRNCR